MPATLQIVREEDSRNQSFQQLASGLAVEFCQECGFKLLPWMSRAFLDYLQKGVEPDMISEVIARTARAPRPSWAYLSAIMARSLYRGITTLPAFLTAPREAPEPLPY